MLSCVVSRAPLLPIGSFTTCTTTSWPSRSRSKIGRTWVGGIGASSPSALGSGAGRAIQADLDERGLHAGHHALHLALVDVADHAAPPAAFDVQLLQHAVLDDS